MLFDDFHVIFGDFLVGTGEPRHIAKKNPNEITLLYGCGFGLKKLGFGQKPTHLVGPKSQLYQKLLLKAPLISISSIVMCETCSSSSVDKQGHGSPPPSCQCQDGNWDKQGRLRNCVSSIAALMMMLRFKALFWSL